MDFFDSTESAFFAYRILFKAVLLIPISHYACGCLFLFLVWLYNFLEFHFLQDLFSGFRGQPVSLTFNSCSDLYNSVVSKCPTLHGRYLATPWLSSPHIQTAFLNFFGRPPVFSYRRKLFHASDGGTLALDWLLHSDVSGSALDMDNAISKDDEIPLMVVIPGLMSDSASAYIKHLAFDTAKHGWNVVVSNHRGLGGISITSDCFYNAGWTEDVREVIDYLHREYPKALLFVVGTSIGANILVKYLGENGEHVPIAGAAAICSPWDLLIGDRFINRKLQQKLYDRALAIGLKEYAELHQPHYTRLADWEGIRKSRSIRDFDNYATCHVGKYETVDTYYRHCSSASFVRSVSLPLLCISALDDPVCTREAIPWDECRANKNVVLATTQHGGHLAFFEGTTAAGLWWVRVILEFFDVLRSSTLMHRQKKTQNAGEKSPVGSTIDQGPFVNVAEDGLVAAMGSELSMSHVVEDASEPPKKSKDESVQDTKKDGKMTQENLAPVLDAGETSKQPASNQDARPLDISSPIRRCFNLISRQNKTSLWLLVYIAIVTSWPLVGSALRFVFKRRLRNVLLSAPVKR